MKAINQTYRKDIDGLRAVAVLSVIIYHINEHLIPGGFIGVDIFFVISGYLISQQIFKDLDKNSFSILEFYRRRVKRIAPVLLFVIAITVILAQFLFIPNDAEKVAESGLWSLLFLANVYFWLFQDVSYFAAASNELPLLHLWSLGIEEQFYIFWPPIILLTYKFVRPRFFFIIFTTVALFSFLYGEYYYKNDPSFVYYMLPTRAGELLTGALLAHYISKNNTTLLSEKLLSITAFIGLMLIAASLFLLNDSSVFPGINAIAPTFGTAMILFSGHYQTSNPNKLLTLKPMIFMGLISYSAYLWHWPVLAFYRYGQSEISLLAGLILFSLTLILAFFSYKYIETPLRHSKDSVFKITKNYYIIPSAIMLAMIVCFMKIDGYGYRWFSEGYKTQLAELREINKPAHKHPYVCQSQLVTKEDTDNPQCVLGNTNSPTKVILWGDSNAAHYVGAISVFAQEAGFSFRNLQIGSCPPIFTDTQDFVEKRRYKDCQNSQSILFTEVNKYKVVIISANWTSYQAQSNEFLKEFFSMASNMANSGKLVILIGKAPVINSYDRLCKEKSISYPFMNCQTKPEPIAANIQKINDQLYEFASTTANIEYYDFNRYICPTNTCSVNDTKGQPRYYDSSHLTLEASWNTGNTIYQEEGVPHPFNLIPHWLSKH